MASLLLLLLFACSCPPVYHLQIRFATLVFLSHPDHELWSSLPRAGKHLAPRLLAEWGDERTRYANATSVQTLAWTAPGPFQSGPYAQEHKRFACVNPRRNSLYQFAWHSTRQEPWALAYY